MSCKYTWILFCRKFLDLIFAVLKREHSSAGSEHLPYKQRVRGSNPCAPTQYQKGFQQKLKPFPIPGVKNNDLL